PMDQGSGQINVYDAAASRVLVEVDGSVSASKIAYGDSVSFSVRVANIGVMSVRVSLDASLLEVFTEEEAPRGVIGFNETTIEIPPGESRIVTLTVETGSLKPGTYAGYVLVYDGERYYRAPFSILIPARLSEDMGVLRAELPTIVGKASGLYIALLDWSAAGIYIESPVVEPAMISVLTQPPFSTPLHARILTPTGALAQLPSSGFLFSSPGLYMVIFELDIISWLLGYAYPTPVNVIVEAPMISELVKAREDILRAAGKILTLENRVNTLERSLDTLKSEVDKLKADVNSIIATVSSLEGRVSQAESNLKALGNEIKSLESKLNSIAKDIAGLYGKVTALEEIIETVKSDVRTLSTELRDFEKSFNVRLEAVEVDLESVRERATLLETGVEGVKRDLKGLESSLAIVSESLNKARRDLEDRISRESEQL
ncbi:MAG: hypothetical protein ACK4H7_04525, partial [Acidilobaceae archaeon]